MAVTDVFSLTLFAGRAGDRNPRGMSGAEALSHALSQATCTDVAVVGTPAPPIPGGWAVQLKAATTDLRLLGDAIGAQLDAGARPLTLMGRCAAGLATLPQVARRRPDAAVVWFDAHGDCNTPQSDDSYLGGMVLTGAAGFWETGLGNGMNLAQVVLVGARDLDPPEMARIATGEVRLVEVGAGLGQRLRQAIDGRSVYVHIDCDVLDEGLVPTEYVVAAGLTFADLREACEVLAESEVIGLEIAEYEGVWSDGRPGDPMALIEALSPLLET